KRHEAPRGPIVVQGVNQLADGLAQLADEVHYLPLILVTETVDVVEVNPLEMAGLGLFHHPLKVHPLEGQVARDVVFVEVGRSDTDPVALLERLPRLNLSLDILAVVGDAEVMAPVSGQVELRC